MSATPNAVVAVSVSSPTPTAHPGSSPGRPTETDSITRAGPSGSAVVVVSPGRNRRRAANRRFVAAAGG